jgi:16S rRNA (cytosine1402-N4)-methyltransferase
MMKAEKEAHHHNNSHEPVLLDAVTRVLAPKPGETYLDLTAGYGGHTSRILLETGDSTKLTLVDRDQNAINSLAPFSKAGARIIHQDFASAAEELAANGEQFDMILIDLGVSSPHLDNAERGFSFQTEAPLDMRMDNRQELTAQTIVNEYSAAELVRVLREYGEEPKAKKIAAAIISARPLATTLDLAAVVETIYSRRGRTHPATRTFQALRIAVNQELLQLETVLPLLPTLLKQGGRVALISFHSLEDRLVKRFFKEETEAGYEARLKVITKKPISGATEDVLNRRARSAMLRAAIKINT